MRIFSRAHRHVRACIGGLAVVLTALAIASAAPSASARTVPGSAVPAFCGGAQPISVSAISSPVKLSSCHIQGRLLLLPMGNNRLGAGVHVPPAGRAVGNFALTKNGEFELEAINNKGVLTVRERTPQNAVGANGAATPAATDPACSQGAYHTEGGYWQSSAVPTLLWYYNESTASRAGLPASGTLTNIKDGNHNMVTGQNNCGYVTGVFPVRGAFEGNTSKYANINSSGSCTSNFPDGQNTVSFGPFNAAALGTGLEALTCFTYNSSSLAMIETDVYLGSNVGMVDSLPSNCSSKHDKDLDLQTIVTHEMGHAYGLAHETSGPAEVMYPYKAYCQQRRHLGEGDYNGMASLYGISRGNQARR